MTRVWFLILICAGLAIYVWQQRQKELRPWSDEEVAVIESLWIGNLEPLAADPSNAVADDPIAAQLGHRLFFDERLSQTGTISCATCHQPDKRFTDGRPKGVAIGVSKRNTLSIIGAAYSPWLYWDGRRDSLWSQALSPLEDPNEHGTNREHVVITVLNDRAYRSKYQSLFGEVPDPMDSAATDTAFANIGKVIAAYERQLLPGPSRFDAYANAVAAGDLDEQAETFTADEKRGLRLFIGEANCTQCHNGPLLTNHEFHNTGVIAFPGDVPDKGRVAGVREVLADPFNCMGAYSDTTTDCAELEFVRTGSDLIGAVRTPSLRNLEGTAPFMHKGQHQTLMDTLKHYNEAPDAMIGHNEAKPLGLSTRELRYLEAFLRTLDAPLATEEVWLRPPSTSRASLDQN